MREGERLIYQGISWKIETLNLYTDLYNPLLEGGTVRLPIKDLIGLRSRPYNNEEKEPWFPTDYDDWVVLSDDFYGKIVEQTPEQVVIETIRGSLKAYPTLDFFASAPTQFIA